MNRRIQHGSASFVAVLAFLFCACRVFAMDASWTPKLLEGLKPGPHRISRDLSKVLKSALTSDLNETRCSAPDPQKFSALKLVHLASSRRTQVIVQGTGECQCSPTGNCTFWVYEKSAVGYKLLLKRGAVQTFSIEDSQSNGYRDIVTGTHGSAFETGLSVFKFNGKQYQRAECWTMLFPNPVADTDEGEVVPKIEKRDCR